MGSKVLAGERTPEYNNVLVKWFEEYVVWGREGGGGGVCEWVGGAPRKGWGGRATGRDIGWVVVGRGGGGGGRGRQITGKLQGDIF